MASKLVEIEKQILLLNPDERAILIADLIRNLDRDQDEETDFEDLWVEEANRRYQELKSGKVKGKTAQQVFEDAKARLQRILLFFIQKQKKK